MRACFIEKMTIWSPRLCPVENSIKRARTKEGFIWITTSREQLWTLYRAKWNFGRTGRFVGVFLLLRLKNGKNLINCANYRCKNRFYIRFLCFIYPQTSGLGEVWNLRDSSTQGALYATNWTVCILECLRHPRSPLAVWLS